MSRALVSAATPLCPAGHLPLKGGDRQSHHDLRSMVTKIWQFAPADRQLGRMHFPLVISPLEGEMSGRTEGGMRSTRGATP
ncbi:lytic murein transglycosylase [Agrobacterium vitis]|nr:lytic murein transglycosylase [Allorhizobium ampelinum]